VNPYALNAFDLRSVDSVLGPDELRSTDPVIDGLPADLASRVGCLVEGGDRIILSRRLHRGAKKAVYYAELADGRDCIVYAWDPAANYLLRPEAVETGAAQFELSILKLQSLGIRVPRIYGLDKSKSEYPIDVAIVEHITGTPIADYWEQDPTAGDDAYRALGEVLHKMHGDRRLNPGPLGELQPGPVTPCESQAMAHGLSDLERATMGVESLGRHRERLRDILERRRAQVKPRHEHGLIHGEIIGDHVLVLPSGEPVLIDTEQIQYFDIEWEHAFLQLLQKPHYEHLQAENLDPARVDFYKVCLHLSYIAGPLTLLENEHPAREFIKSIIHHHVNCLMKLLESGTGGASASGG
jgi:Phosphotransferase enzyme family